jgi:hypothetical protein
MKRPRHVRLLHRDWVGYSILVLICGVALIAAVFLPWANADTGHSVNFALGKPDSVLGVIQTRWGVPALITAIVVTLVGVVMIAARPRRYSLVLGFLLAAAGAVSFALADNASSQIGDPVRPGIGLYATLLLGVLLVPIGLATAIVAFMLSRGYGAGPSGASGSGRILGPAPVAPLAVTPTAPLAATPVAPPVAPPVAAPAAPPEAPRAASPGSTGRSAP